MWITAQKPWATTVYIAYLGLRNRGHSLYIHRKHDHKLAMDRSRGWVSIVMDFQLQLVGIAAVTVSLRYCGGSRCNVASQLSKIVDVRPAIWSSKAKTAFTHIDVRMASWVSQNDMAQWFVDVNSSLHEPLKYDRNRISSLFFAGYFAVSG